MRRAPFLIGLLIGAIALASSLGASRARAQDRGAARSEVHPDARVERWLAQADRLVARGRMEAATRLYRRAAERAPADARGPLALSRLLVPDSVEDRRAIEPDAATRSVVAEVAALLEQVGDVADPSTRAALKHARLWTTAIAGDHRSAIERAALGAGLMDSASADLLRTLAGLAIARHDLEAADSALDAARRADPVDPTLVTDQATVRLARGRANEAVAILEDAVHRRPEDIELRRDLAGALLSAGRPREALSQFSAVITGRPNDPGAELDAARAAFEAGDYRHAVSLSALAAQHGDPNDPEPLLLEAAAHLALGERALAANAFREATRRSPDDARAREGLRALP